MSLQKAAAAQEEAAQRKSFHRFSSSQHQLFEATSGSFC